MTKRLADRRGRWARTTWPFGLAAIGGLTALALAVVLSATQCYDICDPRSESWFSRQGAWERWVQLALATVGAASLAAAALGAARSHHAWARWLLGIAAVSLSLWLYLLLEI